METFDSPLTGKDLTVFNDEEKTNLVIALNMAYQNYDTVKNGGIYYDRVFKTTDEQNEYAQKFRKLENKFRMIMGG